MIEREKIGMPVEDFMEQFAEQPFKLIDGKTKPMPPVKFDQGDIPQVTG